MTVIAANEKRTEIREHASTSESEKVSEEELEEESEDENAPDAKFIENVQKLHTDGHLSSIIECSFDEKRNPLLTTCKNGKVVVLDTAILKKEFPDFWSNLMKVRKRHGCYTFLNKFLKCNYENSLHDDCTLLRLSQIQYCQISIMYLKSNKILHNKFRTFNLMVDALDYGSGRLFRRKLAKNCKK